MDEKKTTYGSEHKKASGIPGNGAYLVDVGIEYSNPQILAFLRWLCKLKLGWGVRGLYTHFSSSDLVQSKGEEETHRSNKPGKNNPIRFRDKQPSKFAQKTVRLVERASNAPTSEGSR